MSDGAFSAPVQFKHTFKDGKKKVDGLFVLKNDTIECEFEQKAVKVVNIDCVQESFALGILSANFMEHVRDS